MLQNRSIAGWLGGILLVGFAALLPRTADAQVGEWAFKRLNTAHEALQEGKYAECLDALNRMKERESKLSDNEVGLMWQTFGHVYFTQSKYKPAAAAFEKSLATGALQPQQMTDMRFNLGQLYMAMERWRDATKIFEVWLKEATNPSPDARFIIGQAYIQSKSWRNALRQIEVAVAGKKKAPESWLQTLATIQYELKEKRDLSRTLIRLIENYPKTAYWLQLGGVYAELNDDKRALAVYQLAYQGNYLSEASHLKNLAQMLIYQNLPLKGAQVLGAELDKKRIPVSEDNLTTLADAYVRAREIEKAIKPLERAAKMSKGGELFLRLAQLHLEAESWDAAVNAASKATDSGKLEDPGQAHLIRGIAAFYSGKRGVAIKALERASKSKNSTTSSVARQWLALIASVA